MHVLRVELIPVSVTGNTALPVLTIEQHTSMEVHMLAELVYRMAQRVAAASPALGSGMVAVGDDDATDQPAITAPDPTGTDPQWPPR